MGKRESRKKERKKKCDYGTQELIQRGDKKGGKLDLKKKKRKRKRGSWKEGRRREV